MLFLFLFGMIAADKALLQCQEHEYRCSSGEVTGLYYDATSSKLKARMGLCSNRNSRLEPFKIPSKLGCPIPGMFLWDQLMTSITMSCMSSEERKDMAQRLEQYFIQKGTPYFSRNQVSGQVPPVSLGSYVVSYDSPRGTLNLEKDVDVYNKYVMLSQHNHVYSLVGTSKPIDNGKTVVFVAMQFFLSSIVTKPGKLVIDVSKAESERQASVGLLKRKVTVYEFEGGEMVVVVAKNWSPASRPTARY